MKNYEVVLTKSYIIKMKAGTAQEAKQLAEFYTSDIKDISTDFMRKKQNFKIQEIICEMNESFDVKEIINNEGVYRAKDSKYF